MKKEFLDVITEQVSSCYAGVADEFKDMFGNVLSVTNIAIADELASAAELVMGKTDHIPVAIVRGYLHASRESTASELIRDRDTDLFR